jgi:ribosomal protein S18 acetylase RimI-like enzyme
VSIHRSNAGTLSWAELTAAFNRIYEGYLLPVQLTETALRRHVEANDLQRRRSPLWRDERQDLVGLALVGVRGARGWIGGFGIAPPSRGKGHGRALMREVLATSASLGVARWQLEVLTGNIAAQRLYAGLGFRPHRELVIYDGRPLPGTAPEPTPGRADPPASEWAQALSACAWASPCWQRESGAWTSLPGAVAVTVRPRDRIDAYAVVLEDGPAIRLADAGARDEAAARQLVRELSARWPARLCALANEPAGSPLDRVLRDAGWIERARQIEMVWSAEPDGPSPGGGAAGAAPQSDQPSR